MGAAFAAPCMEENNEKMAALLVSIAYTGSRVDPAIIVSPKRTSVKPSQKIATPALPCFRLANALYALLRAGFSCSARAAALRITCLVRPAEDTIGKKFLQVLPRRCCNKRARTRSTGTPVLWAVISAPAPWSARPSGCDQRARPIVGGNPRPLVGASLGL